eukprot:CAMPEP_0194373582 /NCGR_PEP_ID=MMETSP0174-20130528/22068_1 /TAXON_ID=216777 /ORGANISM="Proboscia alata, Strain PI-D3" /LENGTH=78 /DNA_ID=CAMNT_0039152769 /DNA_START=1058 /DNA_END=1294 /DNA_ORIENTATION=-
MEGRIRLIMVPNDERTVGLFPTTLTGDGGTAQDDLHVLNTTIPLLKHAIEFELGPGQGIASPYLCCRASPAYSFRIGN